MRTVHGWTNLQRALFRRHQLEPWARLGPSRPSATGILIGEPLAVGLEGRLRVLMNFFDFATATTKVVVGGERFLRTLIVAKYAKGLEHRLVTLRTVDGDDIDVVVGSDPIPADQRAHISTLHHYTLDDPALLQHYIDQWMTPTPPTSSDVPATS